MLRQGSHYALARGFVLSAVPVLAAILLLIYGYTQISPLEIRSLG
jgi:hypothetical protein